MSGLLDALEVVRKARRATSATGDARGRLSSDETELLRAAIVFTSSGLDATLHRLVRDALPILGADTRKDSYARFTNFRAEEINKPTKPTPEFAAAITSATPLEDMLNDWVERRARGSYQGTGDLKKRVRDPLGIPTADITDSRIDALKDFFTARNNIVHEMDYRYPNTGTGRRSRALGDVIKECDLVFSLANDLIHETARQLR